MHNCIHNNRRNIDLLLILKNQTDPKHNRQYKHRFSCNKSRKQDTAARIIVITTATIKCCCKDTDHRCSRCFPIAEQYGFTFVGGHPMAGSEKTGFAHSNSYLIENVYYVITTSDGFEQKKADKLASFVKSLGAIPVIMDYKEHDYLTSKISHLPHVIAAGLVNDVLDGDTDNMLKSLAAGGFKDITRIASSSPVMWQHICLTNNKNIVNELDKYISSLSNIRNIIASKDSDKIYDFFDSAKKHRDSIHTSRKGATYSIFELYCDLKDETGAIANIAKLLATNNINIKNIGIIHNREYEQGALHLELYNQKSLDDAIILLRKNNYMVYEQH